MKLVSKLVFFLAVTLQVNSANAFEPDVRSGGKYAADYPEYVHVVIDNSDKTASFFYCTSNKATDCKSLGSRPKYKLRDLQLKEQRLHSGGIRMLALDGGVLVGAALAGTITTLLSPTPLGPGAILLYAASGAAGAGVFVIKNYFVPGADTGFKRLRDSSLLAKSLLAGQDVQVNQPITEFAKDLDNVLKDMI